MARIRSRIRRLPAACGHGPKNRLFAVCGPSGGPPGWARHWAGSQFTPGDAQHAPVGEKSGLAPRLPEELLAEALRAAIEVWDDMARARALGALAPRLPEELLAEALRAAIVI